MPAKHTADCLIARLQAVGRFLDRVADTTSKADLHVLAREHANTIWQAAKQLEDLTELVEDLAPIVTALIDGQGDQETRH